MTLNGRGTERMVERDVGVERDAGNFSRLEAGKLRLLDW